MAETATSQGIVESLVQLVREFNAVATSSPEQAVLLALGTLLTAFSIGLFGFLAVGGLLGALKALLPTGSRPPQAR